MLDINTALTTPARALRDRYPYPRRGLRQGPTRTQAVVLLLDEQGK
jgi:hypothetical protein